ncbi:MAG: leucyl aminopeptidase [Acidimicrobiia bacterium]|nr:MAG: leucyl aminopeptidase [Acidimicrobiia bacterium]
MVEILGGGSLEETSGDLLAVPVFADTTFGPGGEAVAERLGDWLETYLETHEFTGKAGQRLSVPGGGLSFAEVLFLGLGDDVDAEAIRRAAGNLGRAAARHGEVVTTLHQIDVDGATEAVALGYLLGSYTFDEYRSEAKPRIDQRLVLLDADSGTAADIERATVVAEGVSLTRDLVNEPAGAKPPAVLAQRAADIPGLAVEIVDEQEARSRGYGGLLAVASGAANPPRMVLLRYEPEGATASVAFVGKGVVFDSGGLSIKPAKAMETMKTDMAGAATVFGAMKAIAALGLPIEVLGVAPLTENMTGGAAMRPGDVFTAYGGKTVEVLNTDAEGRLILADGLAIATESGVDLIVDIATLTGGAKVGLGLAIGAVLGNDDDAVASVLAAGRFAGEKWWQLPLEMEYRSKLDSSIADVQNVASDSYGGAINAALFLSEFVGDTPWVHLDIAGPGRTAKNEHYLTKGGSGFGVRTLVELAVQMSRKSQVSSHE